MTYTFFYTAIVTGTKYKDWKRRNKTLINHRNSKGRKSKISKVGPL